jgi:ABC-2 type transport system permease protein
VGGPCARTWPCLAPASGDRPPTGWRWRPGDLYLRLAAFDLGRTLSVLVTRTAPTLAVAALVLPLRLPGTLGGLAMLAASLVLAAVVSFQFRFLFGSAAFWTPDYRSMFMLVFPVLWLVSGFVIPVDFFPGPLRALVDWSPLIPLLMAPVRVATGRSAGQAVAGQVAWVVVLWLVGRLVLAVASRRLVVHGG